jgi:hypothetical protein
MLNLVHRLFHGMDGDGLRKVRRPAALHNEEDLRPGEIIQRKFDLKDTQARYG